MRPIIVPGRIAQSGFALMEIAIAAALAALAAVWAADAWVDRVEDAGAQATAQWLLAVHHAMVPALARIEQHDRGEAGEPLPPALAAGPTVAGLKSLGYLDAGFPERSAWGQPASIHVLRKPGCPGPACQMDVLIHSSVGAADDPGLSAERVGGVLLSAAQAGAVHGHAPQRLRGPVFDLPNPPAAGMSRLPPGTIALMVPGSPAQEDIHVRMRDARDPGLRGNLSVAGQANVGANLGVGGGARVAGSLEVVQDVAARRDLSVRRDLLVNGRVSVAGSVTGQGRVTAGEYLQVRGRALAGAGCAEPGLIGQDDAGTLLVCTGSAWLAQGGGFGGAYVEHDTRGCVNYFRHPSPNPRTGACSCPPGYTAFLIARHLTSRLEDGEGMVSGYLCQR